MGVLSGRWRIPAAQGKRHTSHIIPPERHEAARGRRQGKARKAAHVVIVCALGRCRLSSLPSSCLPAPPLSLFRLALVRNRGGRFPLLLGLDGLIIPCIFVIIVLHVLPPVRASGRGLSFVQKPSGRGGKRVRGDSVLRERACASPQILCSKRRPSSERTRRCGTGHTAPAPEGAEQACSTSCLRKMSLV